MPRAPSSMKQMFSPENIPPAARHILVLAVAILCVGPVFGQDVNSADQQQAMNQLMQQIQELQQRAQELQQKLAVLEAGQHAISAPSASTTASAAATADAAPTQPVAPTPIPEAHSFGHIEWRGYGEMDYKVVDQRAPELGTYGYVSGSAGNFYTGDFGLFLNSRLSDKASVLAELDFEEGDAQSFKVDVRRMLFDYAANDHLRLSFGRMQTSLGYYNWAFRSAAWLQTTADRPLVMEFASNGGLLPTQAIGISATGSIPSGALGLNYVAQYGSSDTVRPDINGDGLLNDENNSNAVTIGMFAAPDRLRGFSVGGSIYHDQISDLVDLPNGEPYSGTILVPSSSARWNQTIVNAHAIYLAHGIEFLNEAFLIRHAPVGPGETFRTPAFYSQLSKKFGPIRPFFRYQYVNASPGNLIYDDVGLRYGPSFGARYDVTDYCAFKAQLDHTARRGYPDLNGLHLQLSGTF